MKSIGVMFLLFINPFFLWSYSEIRYSIDQYRVMATTFPLWSCGVDTAQYIHIISHKRIDSRV